MHFPKRPVGVVIPGLLEANAETLTAVDAEADTALDLGAYLVHGEYLIHLMQYSDY